MTILLTAMALSLVCGGAIGALAMALSLVCGGDSNP